MNPLLEAWSEGRSRKESVRRYAWAIPTADALDAIAALGPVVEVGAGTGYWASLLAHRGVDVVCYDLYPPDGTDLNGWHEGALKFHTVHQGGPEKAGEHPDRTLFLCWPPRSPTPVISLVEPTEPGWERKEGMVDGEFRTLWYRPGEESYLAYEALTVYEAAGGRTVVYVGEDPGGVTGDDRFHDLLARWREVARVELPQWEGVGDAMWVFERSD